MRVINKIKNKLFKIFYNSIFRSEFIVIKLRTMFLRLWGVKIGANSKIRDNVRINSNKLVLGRWSSINSDSKIYNSSNDCESGYVKIGNSCNIGYNVVFCTISHEILDEKSRAGKHIDKDIIVEDGCWICANVTVLQGVTIGKGCVIAAGSVVNKSTEPNGLYAGVPAKRIKDL